MGYDIPAIVAETGAILLGSYIAVDGYYPRRRIRIVTHIHEDHTRGLAQSIRESDFIAATPLTLDLLEALGKRVPPAKKLEMPYGVRVRIEDDIVELRKANHIPGAAEVIVELRNGLQVGYTGDFKLPGTEILKGLDVLVIDATYGLEEHIRPWQDEMEYILSDIVREGLIHGPVHLYAYNGKVEEVMLILRRFDIDAPFIVSRRVYNTTKVLCKHGYCINDVYIARSKAAEEAQQYGYYVQFHHYSSWWSRRRQYRGTHILLTGWELREPYRQISPNEWIVSFSDHADFRQLVNYVEEAKPRLLIVDAYRGGRSAYYFASYVSKRLGIEALAMP
ncbi:MBL fold metallo-hydrolase [Pyrofollis japonicus]|uniref:MBL fold metallo-hydrolase n=1 Tax=Pyrofollis japonicus TaxID=3060460 RepID=UPI00295AB2ED|nr:MBL fold metallo-hydrolase [Pyrofollis japonicus]BEP17702.1 MBL fold metallo-hydrolase [Pyrofollis japonicus]